MTLSANNLPVPSIVTFQCNDGTLVITPVTCDGNNTCPDNSDEKNCHSYCKYKINDSFLPKLACDCRNCLRGPCSCHPLYFHCQQGACVPLNHLCDRIQHCADMSDEYGCTYTQKAFYTSPMSKVARHKPVKHLVERLSEAKLSRIYCDERHDYISCSVNYDLCYHQSAICMYDLDEEGQLEHCPDGTHLGQWVGCMDVHCSYGYKCFWSYCIPVRKICDGAVDCPNGDDEMHCENLYCPGLL